MSEFTPDGDQPAPEITPKPTPFYRIDSAQIDRWHQLPGCLQEWPQFVSWRYKYSRDRWAKVPFNPSRPQSEADVTNPITWAPLTDAVASCSATGDESNDGNSDGIGFVLTENDPFVGIDLDKCRNAITGEIAPWAQTIIDRLDSYTEISPSGKGIRILCRGTLPPGRRRSGDIEMYDDKRYVTLTGHALPGRDVINEGGDSLQEWHREVFGERAACGETKSPDGVAAAPRLDDQAVLDKAFLARNGSQTRDLYCGNTSSCANDDSTADLSLVARFAFFTRDAAQIDRLFRGSQLMRPKWDEPRGGTTYGAQTIAKALRTSTGSYQAHQNGKPPHHLDDNLHSSQRPVEGDSDGGDGECFETHLQSPAEPLPSSALLPEGHQEQLPDMTPLPGGLLRRFSDLAKLPPVEWLIDDYFMEHGFFGLIGPYGCGKTLVLLDMIFCIATGIEYHGHAVKQGPVLLIEAEGVGRLEARKDAWLAAHPEVDPAVLEANCVLVTQAIQISEASSLEPLLAEMKAAEFKPVLTVIDTLARCNVGKDENNVRDMGLFVAGCDRIKEMTGGAVMVVHHTGKSGEVERGSTSLMAAADTKLICTMDESKIITVKGKKQKDGPDTKPGKFRLVPDEASGSVYLELIAGGGAGGDTLSADDRKFLEALRVYSDEGGLEWMPLQQIKKYTTLAERSLQRLLQKMVRQGHLEAKGTLAATRYRVAPNRPLEFDESGVPDEQEEI